MPVLCSRYRWKYSNDCRSFLTTHRDFVLISLVLTIVAQRVENIHSVQTWLKGNLNFKHCYPAKKVVKGKHSIDNTMFTKRLLMIFFLSTAWTLFLYIILSGDVHANPGPESLSSISSSYTSQSSFSLSNNLSIFHLNIQSLLPKIDVLDAEMQHYDVLVFTVTWLSPQNRHTGKIGTIGWVEGLPFMLEVECRVNNAPTSYMVTLRHYVLR